MLSGCPYPIHCASRSGTATVPPEKTELRWHNKPRYSAFCPAEVPPRCAPACQGADARPPQMSRLIFPVLPHIQSDGTGIQKLFCLTGLDRRHGLSPPLNETLPALKSALMPAGPCFIVCSGYASYDTASKCFALIDTGLRRWYAGFQATSGPMEAGYFIFDRKRGGF